MKHSGQAGGIPHVNRVALPSQATMAWEAVDSDQGETFPP